MGTRGPKSTNDLTVVQPDSVERAAPPGWMTDEAKHAWLRVVNGLPAGHFHESQLPILEQYVRHKIEASHVSQLIQAATAGDAVDMNEYDRLLKMQERESRVLASLAVRLDFASSTAKVPPGGSKPWE